MRAAFLDVEFDAGFGSLQPTFDGRQRNVARVGDLAQFVAFDVTQDPGRSLSARQLAQDRIDASELESRAWIGARQGLTFERGVVFATVEPEHTQKAAASKAPMHLVHRDPHQPGPKQLGLPQLPDAFERHEETLLHHVLGFGASPQQAHGHGDHTAHVPPIQTLFRGAFSATYRAYQRSVVGVRVGVRRDLTRAHRGRQFPSKWVSRGERGHRVMTRRGASAVLITSHQDLQTAHD
jgi:hypothetical protein